MDKEKKLRFEKILDTKLMAHRPEILNSIPEVYRGAIYEAMEEVVIQFTQKQSAGVWVNASDRLPTQKGRYIIKYPTVNKRDFVVKEEIYNPKYEDIKEKWISWDYIWLDELSAYTEDDIKAMAEAKYPVSNMDGNWLDVPQKNKQEGYIKACKDILNIK